MSPDHDIKDNPDERPVCIAHLRPIPCKECRIAALEFIAECQREEAEEARDEQRIRRWWGR